MNLILLCMLQKKLEQGKAGTRHQLLCGMPSLCPVLYSLHSQTSFHSVAQVALCPVWQPSWKENTFSPLLLARVHDRLTHFRLVSPLGAWRKDSKGELSVSGVTHLNLMTEYFPNRCHSGKRKKYQETASQSANFPFFFCRFE